MPRFTRQETIQRFRAGMARLLATVESLSPAQRAAPVYHAWTVRELLVHVAAWDRALVPAIEAVRTGRQPPFAGDREAAFNSRAIDESESVPFGGALAEVKAAHRALIARMRKLTDDEWSRSAGQRGRNGRPQTVGSLFGYAYNGETHYGGHAKEIEAWRAGRR